MLPPSLEFPLLLVQIQPHTTEVALPNVFRYKDIFNNLSVHYFTSQNLKLLPVEFWEYCEQPVYETNTEIIQSESV